MKNNENILSHSPTQESAILRKKIEHQFQQTTLLDQNISDLNAKIKAAQQRINQKKHKSNQIQNKLKEEKKKQSQILNTSTNQNTQISNHSKTIHHPNLQIINQLREHFKALKIQMMEELIDEDDDYQDEVDVDNMTYQQLLELQEKIGKVSKGLDTKKIQFLQVKKYHNLTPNQTTQCAICRQELQQGVDSIQLNCHHIFHQECIKGWLNVQKNCPNCKREINL